MRYVRAMKVTGEYLGDISFEELIDQSGVAEDMVIVFPFVEFSFDSELLLAYCHNFELSADNVPTGKVFQTKMRSGEVKTALTWDEMQAANAAVGVYPAVVTNSDSPELNADRASVSFSLYLLGYRDISIDVNEASSGYVAMIDKLNALGVFADTARYEQVKKGILIS